MTDVDVVEAVRNGDKNRYSELVERYQKMVYGIAWSRLGDAGLCEDAAQETFIKAFRYLAALRNPEKFSGWLARIARNVSTSLLRKRGREIDKRKRWRVHQLTSQPIETDSAEEKSLGETLRQTLTELPQQHRECLVLFYLEGKNVRETAGLLGISEAAMKTRLHRARRALRGQLEEKLDSSLSALGARKGFSAGVMLLLPSTPLAAGGLAGSSVIVKVFGGLAKSLLSSSMLLWMSLVQFVPAVAMFGWLGKLEAANLLPRPGTRFRKRLIRSSVVIFIIGGASAILTSRIISFHFGHLVVFQLLVPFCAWGTYAVARTLRVNRSLFTVGMVLSNATFLFVSVLIGFLHAPYWTFLAALLVLNIILYHTNKTRPMRHDYNLFLRQAKGLLGTPDGLATKPAGVTHTEMRAFARFLGKRFLVRDYSLDNDRLVLRLPPVKPGMEQFLGFTGSTSRLSFGFDGRCEAHLGNRDNRNLHRLAEGESVDQRVLEEEVAVVAGSVLGLFLDGRFDQAESLLEAETDRNIFVKPTAQAKEHRWRGRIAIIAAVPLLIFSVWASRFGNWDDWRPRPVSHTMAREAIAEWSLQDSSTAHNIMMMLGSDKHPPLDFIGPENRDGYKDAVVRFLSERPIIDILGNPRRLYHVIENQILTEKELADIGLSPASVREALEKSGEDALKKMDEATRIRVMDDTGPYNVMDVTTIAYRMACLEKLVCLDLVDADRISTEIAAKQVTRNWKLPEGYKTIDVEKGAGLFHFGWCSLRETRGALWALQILGRLDLIDREACLDAILRFYKGKGVFRANHRKDGIHIYGNEGDAFRAMECIAILDGFDRVKDLDRWKFKPETSSRKKDGEWQHRLVTAESIKAWAYQLRLEEIRGH